MTVAGTSSRPCWGASPSTAGAPASSTRAERREQVAAAPGARPGRLAPTQAGGAVGRAAPAGGPGPRHRRPARGLPMDEPLSNLDAKLRAQTRVELVELHRRLGTTFVYVTHDQVEAMTMADRIAVMSDGAPPAGGPPQDVYARPRNLFVARFMGSPPMNTLPARWSTARADVGCGRGAGRAGLELPAVAPRGAAVVLGRAPRAPGGRRRPTASWPRPRSRAGRRRHRRRVAGPRAALVAAWRGQPVTVRQPVDGPPAELDAATGAVRRPAPPPVRRRDH